MAVLVFDQPSSIRIVKKDESSAWQKSEEELFAIALENTVQKINPEVASEPVENDFITLITSDHILTAASVLRLNRFPECIGMHGSMVAIPNRGTIMCYPINDLGVVKMASLYMTFVPRWHAEGPGSLSPRIYWYKDGLFTDLPYRVEENELRFSLPQSFVEVLNQLSEPKT